MYVLGRRAHSCCQSAGIESILQAVNSIILRYAQRVPIDLSPLNFNTLTARHIRQHNRFFNTKVSENFQIVFLLIAHALSVKKRHKQQQHSVSNEAQAVFLSMIQFISNNL